MQQLFMKLKPSQKIKHFMQIAERQGSQCSVWSTSSPSKYFVKACVFKILLFFTGINNHKTMEFNPKHLLKSVSCVATVDETNLRLQRS